MILQFGQSARNEQDPTHIFCSSKIVVHSNRVLSINKYRHRNYDGEKVIQIFQNISTCNEVNFMNIANIKMVVIIEEYLYIIKVFVLHTVFEATQIVHHPACVTNSVENYDILEENVYVTKENVAHTTADDYTTQPFELFTDNNTSTVFDPSFISLVSESRSIFYLDELFDHH